MNMPIRTTKDRVVVEKTGHPASFRKMRCPKCKMGQAVESNTKKGQFVCNRCGTVVSESAM